MMNQIPYLNIITPPEVEPLTLAEAKLSLRVDGSGDDSFIVNLIKAARVMAEEYLKRSLITQSWQLQYDQYAPSVVVLPRGPVQKIDHVKIIARDWSEQIVDSLTYFLNAGKEQLVFDAAPVGHIVQIQYDTGYGDSSAIPQSIKQGMLAHIVSMYENRMENKGIPEAAMALYDQHRIMKF